MSYTNWQRKGRNGEIELAAILTEYGYSVKPGTPLNYGTEPDLSGLPGIHVKCKRVEKLNITEALNQAIRDSERFHDGLPALFHRKNRQEWLVTMRLDDWVKLYSENQQKKGGIPP